MERAIVGFRTDAEGDPVAVLSCGHGRHVRHDPPFQERPWTETEAGRRSRLGAPLDCVRCDRRELPEGHAPYKRTAEFNEETVAKGLLARHTTRAGVWGLIHVSAGRLAYRVHGPYDTSEVLEAGTPGVVLPEVEHEVEPLGPVRFHVEFWRRAEEP